MSCSCAWAGRINNLGTSLHFIRPRIGSQDGKVQLHLGKVHLHLGKVHSRWAASPRLEASALERGTYSPLIRKQLRPHTLHEETAAAPW